MIPKDVDTLPKAGHDGEGNNCSHCHCRIYSGNPEEQTLSKRLEHHPITWSGLWRPQVADKDALHFCSRSPLHSFVIPEAESAEISDFDGLSSCPGHPRLDLEAGKASAEVRDLL